MTSIDSFSRWIVCGILFTLSGCAVLTESQIKETNRFATVAEGYSGLPGTVIDQLANLEKSIRLLEATNRTLPERQPGEDEARFSESKAHATKQISERYRMAQSYYDTFKKDQARLEHSLQFLDTYTKGLKALISNDSIEDLDKQAESLGKSLDKATGQLVKLGLKTKEGTDLGIIGSATAATVRGIGGLVLSYHQARYVKEFTTAYHPHLETAAKAVTTIMTELAPRTATNEAQIDSFLQTHFVTHHRIDTSTFLAADQQTQLNHKLETSATAVMKASNALVDAHVALLKELETRHTLKNAIETITVLAGHVQAALDLKKKLEKAS